MGVDGHALSRAFAALLWMGFIAGGMIVGLAIWLLPMLWHWLKPLLHQVTS